MKLEEETEKTIRQNIKIQKGAKRPSVEDGG